VIGPEGDTVRFTARVIGCITPGCVDIVLGPGIGMLDGGIPTVLPFDLVPSSLRMPNSEFVVIMDPRNHNVITVEPLG
jgi:hypothetical protein